MQNFELVECYYDQIYICTVIVDLHLKISKIQCQLHTIFKRNNQNKSNMSHLSASAVVLFFITPEIISIMAENMSEKFSALAATVVKEPCLCESKQKCC